MIFLDTCVFLYAAGADHAEKAPCERLLALVARGDIEATTNTEVVQEIVFVLDRRGRRPEAIRLARAVAGLFPGVLPVTRDDLRAALEVLETAAVPPRDAIHAGTMRTHRISVVVSVDAHFDAIPGVVRRTPSEIVAGR